MKTRLLWTLILSVGAVATYCGLVRPEVSTTPKKIQEYIEKDPATRPPIQMPPLVVSESKLPAEPARPSPDGLAREQPAIAQESQIESRK